MLIGKGLRYINLGPFSLESGHSTLAFKDEKMVLNKNVSVTWCYEKCSTQKCNTKNLFIKKF